MCVPFASGNQFLKQKEKSGYFSDYSEAVKIEKASDRIILRHFEVRKSYAAHGTGEYTLSYHEDYRAVFQEKFHFYYPVYSCLAHKNVWKEKYIDPYFHYRYHLDYTIKSISDDNPKCLEMVYPYNLKNVFKRNTI